LAGGVDPDHARRRVFEAHYGAPAYVDIASAMSALQPNVVVVATPTAIHGQTVQAVLRAGQPAAILCEKPLSFEIGEARDMVDACAERGCSLYVNYMRRSDHGVIEIKHRLSKGQIGGPVKGVVWYSKGLFNNGSHFLNLLQYWFGDVTGFRIFEPGRLWDGLDPEPDLAISFAHGTVYFLSAHEEDFSHYTIELVAPNGRLRYEQGGGEILWQGRIEDTTCDGYTILDAAGETIKSDFARVQWHVADQLAASLHGRQAQICTGTEAMQTLEILAEIRSKL